MIILKIKNVAIQINRKGEKISVLSSVKINKYEYLTDAEIMLQIGTINSER